MKSIGSADNVSPVVTGSRNYAHLFAWLVLNGYAEPIRGYGHVSGDELAQALIASGWVVLDDEG